MTRAVQWTSSKRYGLVTTSEHRDFNLKPVTCGKCSFLARASMCSLKTRARTGQYLFKPDRRALWIPKSYFFPLLETRKLCLVLWTGDLEDWLGFKEPPCQIASDVASGCHPENSREHAQHRDRAYPEFWDHLQQCECEMILVLNAFAKCTNPSRDTAQKPVRRKPPFRST